MRYLQHNIVNVLHLIRSLAESHIERDKDHSFENDAVALKHAQLVIKKVYQQANRAMEIMKRLKVAMWIHPIKDTLLNASSLNVAWEKSVNLINQRYRTSSLEVITHIPEAFPEAVCDERDLVEIFYYLSQNSVQAMKRSGKLIVRVTMQLSEYGKPEAVIALSDTGPGIGEPVMGSVFEPFFTTKNIKQGNGLGLYLVKGLVSRNGGRISVSSFKGCGTTFVITFPISKSEKISQV